MMKEETTSENAACLIFLSTSTPLANTLFRVLKETQGILMKIP